MFGTTKLWAILGIISALGAALVWHDHRVTALKAEVLTQEHARVAVETGKLIASEAVKAADNAAQSEREAGEHEETMMHMTRAIEAASLKIEELEKGSKCTVSRETVRMVNGLR